MRTINKTVYQAFDGTEHLTEDAARAHEKQHAIMAIVGLTLDEALAIVSREDAERADAVERIGKQIERQRIEAGELKRGPNKAKTPEPQPEPASTIPITSPGKPWPPAAKPDDTAKTDAGSEADALTA